MDPDIPILGVILNFWEQIAPQSLTDFQNMDPSTFKPGKNMDPSTFERSRSGSGFGKSYWEC